MAKTIRRVMRRFLYSNLSSNLNCCSSVSCCTSLDSPPQPRFYPHGSFSLFFSTSSKATIATAVFSSLSILNELCWIYLSIYIDFIEFYKRKVLFKKCNKCSCKLISFNLKNEKFHLKNYEKWLFKLI